MKNMKTFVYIANKDDPQKPFEICVGWIASDPDGELGVREVDDLGADRKRIGIIDFADLGDCYFVRGNPDDDDAERCRLVSGPFPPNE